MSDALVRDAAVWGIALETTLGTGLVPSIGFPNLNRSPIKAGSSWSEQARATGKTVDSDIEMKADVANPQWNPTTTLFHPHAGWLFYACCQNASQTGTGPFVQTVQPDMTVGRKLENGTAVASHNRGICAGEKIGQTGARDIRASGGIISRIDVKIGSSGLVEVTTSWLFLNYSDSADLSAGVFTLPGSTLEKLSTDFVMKAGSNSAPFNLYSEETNFSLIPNITVKRYGGMNALNPYAFVINSWAVEGSISKPVLVGANRMSKNYTTAGGVVTPVIPIFIYSRTLADFNTALTVDGQMRFTLNVRLDDPELDLSDETVEKATFKGKADATNNIFKFEQCTTATQAAWAS